MCSLIRVASYMSLRCGWRTLILSRKIETALSVLTVAIISLFYSFTIWRVIMREYRHRGANGQDFYVSLLRRLLLGGGSWTSLVRIRIAIPKIIYRFYWIVTMISVPRRRRSRSYWDKNRLDLQTFAS